MAVGRQYAAVAVSRLDGGAVKDKDDQKQTETASKGHGMVLDCLREHAGHCLDVVDSGSLRIVHNILDKSSSRD